MTGYDEVPYPALAFAPTHPRRLRTMAWLFGLEAPDPARCSVLELGCADGGNLLPMASSDRESRFLGIDLDDGAIARARADAQELGLANVEFRVHDLRTPSAGLGRFDYVIAHGVYSWVPEPVRDRLLALCAECLAPQGVAYVSYNAWPGWHERAATRELLLHHARGVADPWEQAARARSLAKEILDARSTRHSERVRSELERIVKRPDAVLLHDELGEVNAPISVHRFAVHAARHGLQFLAEAELQDMDLMDPVVVRAAASWQGDPASSPPAGGFDGVFPEELLPDPARRIVERSAAILAHQQYADFLTHRSFRRTLLCRAEIALDHAPQGARLAPLHVTGSLRPIPKGDRAAPGFRSSQGATLRTDHAPTRAALEELVRRAPASASFEELATLAIRADGGATPPDRVRTDLGGTLLHCWDGRFVDLHRDPPRESPAPGVRPRAVGLARLQAGRGPGVTNLRHESIALEDAFAHALLLRLDGTRDRGALRREMERLVGSGDVVLGGADGKPLGAREALRRVPNLLEAHLASFERYALLEG